MSNKTIQLHLGIGACIACIFLLAIAIPTWVSSPSNVRFLIMSPVFWPATLAILTGIVGLGLLLDWRRAAPEADEPENLADSPKAARLRLLGMAAIMLVTMYALPRAGMVWTCMLVFVASAFLVKTRHPVAAIVCAVAVPLVLYAFFAHVAGVAIPQGNFVRLP
jgi:hypothetical protein